MSVSYENAWVCFIGSYGLIVFLHAVKAFSLHYLRPALAGMTFSSITALCVPATWALSPDWDNESVLWVANYVGNPVMTLTVPIVSFLIDWTRPWAGPSSRWWLRVPFEWLVAVPVWFYFWVCLEFFVLGWVRAPF
jgi:hypothetical protein